MEKTPLNAGLAKAAANYATLADFARALGVRYQVVQQWFKNGVPLEHCPEIEKLTGVRCEELSDKMDWAYLRATETE